MLLKPKLPKQKQFKRSGGCPVSSILGINLIGLNSKRVKLWKWKTFTSSECFQGPVAFYVHLEIDTDWTGHKNLHIATQDGVKYWELDSEKCPYEFYDFMRHIAGMSRKPISWWSRLRKMADAKYPRVLCKPSWAYDIRDREGEVKKAIQRYAKSITL